MERVGSVLWVWCVWRRGQKHVDCLHSSFYHLQCKSNKSWSGYRINHTTVSTAVLKCIIIYHFISHISHYMNHLTTISSNKLKWMWLAPPTHLPTYHIWCRSKPNSHPCLCPPLHEKVEKSLIILVCVDSNKKWALRSLAPGREGASDTEGGVMNLEGEKERGGRRKKKSEEVLHDVVSTHKICKQK